MTKFRSENPPQSGLGSLCKETELDLMMLKQIEKHQNGYGEEHDVQSHMLRPTITDMQDKYCGNCYDIYPIQSQDARGGAAFGRGGWR